jgi:hypothetical protein
MTLPADWKTRLEGWWQGKPSHPACRGCGLDTDRHRKAVEWAPGPEAVALVCPTCGHAHLFLWSRLHKLLP